MKQYHKNPRKITKQEQELLKSNLEKLGDLSGIIHNLETDEIIGGNQRSEVININKCKIEMIKEFSEPDEQGTVGLGFIIWKKKNYNYRQVRWDEKTAEMANITANKLGGEWDMEILAEFNTNDLLDWGFKDFELEGLDINLDIIDSSDGKDTRTNRISPKEGLSVANLGFIHTTIEKEWMQKLCEKIRDNIEGETDGEKLKTFLERAYKNESLFKSK